MDIIITDSSPRGIAVVKSLSICQRALELYDRAPELALKYFGESMEENPQAVKTKVGALLSQKRSNDEQAEISVAYNYAAFYSSIKSGNVEGARGILENMVAHETPLTIIDGALNGIETSLLEVCLGSGTLLTPSQIDQGVFETHAPDSLELSNSYYAHQALAVAYKLPKGRGFFVNLQLDKSTFRGVERIPEGRGHLKEEAITLEVEPSAFEYGGPEDKLVENLGNIIGGCWGIKDHGIVISKSPHLIAYLAPLFRVRRLGKLVNESSDFIGDEPFDNVLVFPEHATTREVS